MYMGQLFPYTDVHGNSQGIYSFTKKCQVRTNSHLFQIIRLGVTNSKRVSHYIVSKACTRITIRNMKLIRNSCWRDIRD